MIVYFMLFVKWKWLVNDCHKSQTHGRVLVFHQVMTFVPEDNRHESCRLAV